MVGVSLGVTKYLAFSSMHETKNPRSDGLLSIAFLNLTSSWGFKDLNSHFSLGFGDDSKFKAGEGAGVTGETPDCFENASASCSLLNPLNLAVLNSFNTFRTSDFSV